VNGSTDFKSLFNAKAARQPEHFRTVCLHPEITERTWVESLVVLYVPIPTLLRAKSGDWHPMRPTKHGLLLAGQDCVVGNAVEPCPAPAIDVHIMLEELTSFKFRPAYSHRQGFGFHAILDTQRAEFV